jgi:hypothetical protein
MTIQLPVLLNDGSTLLVDADFDRRLREGDATVGWTGDERLGVYYADGRVEIRRLCEDGELRTVMRSRPGRKILDTQALRFLAEHDSQSRRAYDVRADMDAHNDQVRRDAERRRQAATEAFAEKLQWALRRDIGALEGGLQKKDHYVSGRSRNARRP